MARHGLLLGFLLLLILNSSTAIHTLQTIKDLKNTTTFMMEFPRHGLMLLQWFANIVDFDSNGEMQLTLDPGQGSYGLHCYANTPRAPFHSSDSLYYSLGDLNQGSARMLPFYVTHDFYHSMESAENNIDRILIQVRKSNPRKVEKVFMTEFREEHHLDPVYEISVQLLRQIRALGSDMMCNANDTRFDFSLCEFLSHQQKAAKVLMVYPPSPGLEWFLTLAGYNIDSRFNIFLQESFCQINPTSPMNRYCYPPSGGIGDVIHNKAKLEVKSTPNGYAKMTWCGIPESIARMKLKIGLYRSRTDAQPLKEYPLNGKTYGSIDTNVPLNPGLRIQLLQSQTISYYVFFGSTQYTTIWKGPEFDEANKIPPINIRGYQSSLQLYTKDGYACARLFIKKSFTSWKNVFDNSWVGIYTSNTDNNGKYQEFEWSIYFKKRLEDDCPMDYDIYQYEFGVQIGPGVQARFMLTRNDGSEKARTVAWEE